MQTLCSQSIFPLSLSELRLRNSERLAILAFRTRFFRSPDRIETTYWQNAFENRDELNDILKRMEAAANEDLLRVSWGHVCTDQDMSHEEFVASLYESILNRKADSAGLQHYSRILGEGMSREQLRNLMKASKEARELDANRWMEINSLTSESVRIIQVLEALK